MIGIIILGLILLMSAAIATRVTRGAFWWFKYTPESLNRMANEENHVNRFRQSKVPFNVDVVVIGAGPGGLACSALLSKAGYKVLLLEQHEVLGGGLHSFDRNGYEFDTGFHYAGSEMDVNNDKFLGSLLNSMCESPIKWQKMDEVFETVVVPGRQDFDVRNTDDKFIEDLCARFPEERAAIERVVKNWKPSLFKVDAPILLSFLPQKLAEMTRSWVKKHVCDQDMFKTAKEVLEREFKSQELRNIFTYLWLDWGPPPSEAAYHTSTMITQYFINGGGMYPVGGPIQIIRKIVPTIESGGGAVLTSANVTKIIVENGKACGVVVNGIEVRTKYVVSCTGLETTYKQLLEECNRPTSGPIFETLLRDKPRMKPSQTFCFGFIGLKKGQSELKVPNRQWWKYQSIDSDKDYQDAMNQSFDEYCETHDELPNAMIGFPSAKDPTYEQRHPHKSASIIVSVVPYHWFEKWEHQPCQHRDEEYCAMKKKIEAMMMKGWNQLFPSLGDDIDFIEIGTPLTLKHYINSAEGSAYGISKTADQFDSTFEWLNPRTHIPNLFVGGQDVYLAGFPPALLGGALAAATLSKSVMFQILPFFFK